MKDGIYYIEFSNKSGKGECSVIINGGKINGGDFGFYYHGEIKGSSALVNVTRHDKSVQSIFGKHHDFDLELLIKETHGDMTIIDGSISGNPEYKIKIKAKFLADLI